MGSLPYLGLILEYYRGLSVGLLKIIYYLKYGKILV